jgi:hypothetical protein
MLYQPRRSLLALRGESAPYSSPFSSFPQTTSNLTHGSRYAFWHAPKKDAANSLAEPLFWLRLASLLVVLSLSICVIGTCAWQLSECAPFRHPQKHLTSKQFVRQAIRRSACPTRRSLARYPRNSCHRRLMRFWGAFRSGRTCRLL